MRKIISLMMVLVLGVALVGPSAFATNPDPNHINPWEYNGRPDPSGDDGGWQDVDSGGHPSLVISIWRIITKHCSTAIFWIVRDDGENGDIGSDGENGERDICTSSRTHSG